MQRYSKSTVLNGIVMARAYEDTITNTSGNTYVGLGRVDSSLSKAVAVDTVEDNNDLFRQLAVLQKITASDVNLVVPDSVWITATVYDQFDSNTEMYLHDSFTQLTGTVSTVSETNQVDGTGTLFQRELSIGDIIQFSGTGNETAYYRKEVVDITSNTNLLSNTTLDSYTANTLYKVTNTYPAYAKDFYVRNTYDQVFICLFNNGGATSTVEPILRPENFSLGKLIQNSSDGYVWRYLYTIPSGLKEKFLFTDADSNSWMPVTTDTIVAETAVDGSIEHIRILDGGSGYNSNTACTSVDIVDITGDGINALYTANVAMSTALNSTTIAGLTSANNGSGYSYANVAADASGTGASFKALISPPGGFGLDPAKDLGAKFLAISVDIAGNVDGNLPISSTAGSVAFRQVSIIRNPQYSNNDYVTASSVAMTSNVKMTGVSINPVTGAVVTQTGSGYKGAVVAFTNPYLLLNNTSGTFAENQPFDSGIGTGQVLETSGIKRSGDVLFVENIDAITRATNQVEQVKLVFKF